MEDIANFVLQHYPSTITLLEKFIPAFIAFVAALFAFVISRRQWRTANYRLCFDLFDRRYAVYEATKSLIEKVPIHGELTFRDLGEYQQALRGSEFLFKGEARE